MSATSSAEPAERGQRRRPAPRRRSAAGPSSRRISVDGVAAGALDRSAGLALRARTRASQHPAHRSAPARPSTLIECADRRRAARARSARALGDGEPGALVAFALELGTPGPRARRSRGPYAAPRGRRRARPIASSTPAATWPESPSITPTRRVGGHGDDGPRGQLAIRAVFAERVEPDPGEPGKASERQPVRERRPEAADNERRRLLSRRPGPARPRRQASGSEVKRTARTAAPGASAGASEASASPAEASRRASAASARPGRWADRRRPGNAPMPPNVSRLRLVAICRKAEGKIGRVAYARDWRRPRFFLVPEFRGA